MPAVLQNNKMYYYVYTRSVLNNNKNAYQNMYIYYQRLINSIIKNKPAVVCMKW